ncbi:hypothetical protein [Sulfitobacter pontiacus]|uniref:hypothetical protein n=1 Tax=Sulfitobacter pontiacus TaxID=60137 RepID=UPI0030EE4A3C
MFVVAGESKDSSRPMRRDPCRLCAETVTDNHNYVKTCSTQAVARTYIPAHICGASNAWMSLSDGAFELFRIGEAVSARDTHAAIYDALRLLKSV